MGTNSSVQMRTSDYQDHHSNLCTLSVSGRAMNMDVSEQVVILIMGEVPELLKCRYY